MYNFIILQNIKIKRLKLLGVFMASVHMELSPLQNKINRLVYLYFTAYNKSLIRKMNIKLCNSF